MPAQWMEITFSLQGLPTEVIEQVTPVITTFCGGVEELSAESGAREIRCYLPATDQGRVSFAELQRELQRLAKMNTLDSQQIIQRCSTRIVKDVDWASQWKSFYRPTRVGQHFVVHPSWEEPGPLHPEDRVILMDPGQAFGTGHHESSRLCIELMEILDIEGWTVADIGCGSGLLSIAAVRAGAHIVWACDIDGIAVETAEKNIRRNDAEETVHIVSGSALALKPHGPFGLVFANLLADILQDIGSQLKAITRPGGYMIWSGILNEQLPEMKSLSDLLEVELQQVQQENEWVALLLRVP